eukprot:4576154-Prymnesium_polylepis.1
MPPMPIKPAAPASTKRLAAKAKAAKTKAAMAAKARPRHLMRKRSTEQLEAEWDTVLAERLGAQAVAHIAMPGISRALATSTKRALPPALCSGGEWS